MQKRNLSAADVARLMRTTSSTVFGWLKGTTPRKRAMEDLAALLQVPEDWLVNLSENEFANEINSLSVKPIGQRTDALLIQEDPMPYRVSAQDELLTAENIALLGGPNARMLLDKMFDKAKADLNYYQRNARAINLLVDYLKTNPEP